MSTYDINKFVIENEEIEVVDNVIFLGTEIERKTECAGEIKRRITLERSAMSKLT